MAEVDVIIETQARVFKWNEKLPEKMNNSFLYLVTVIYETSSVMFNKTGDKVITTLGPVKYTDLTVLDLSYLRYCGCGIPSSSPNFLDPDFFECLKQSRSPYVFTNFRFTEQTLNGVGPTPVIAVEYHRHKVLDYTRECGWSGDDVDSNYQEQYCKDVEATPDEIAVILQTLKSGLAMSITEELEQVDNNEPRGLYEVKSALAVGQYFRGCQSSSSYVDPCSICLERFRNGGKITETSCGHKYHRSCVLKWLCNNKTSCPMCRSTCVTLV